MATVYSASPSASSRRARVWATTSLSRLSASLGLPSLPSTSLQEYRQVGEVDGEEKEDFGEVEVESEVEDV